VGKRRIIEVFIYPLIKYLDEGVSVRSAILPDPLAYRYCGVPGSGLSAAATVRGSPVDMKTP
jgi:hypothetical protein